MKNVLLIMMSLFLLSACANSEQKKIQNSAETITSNPADSNTVYVYYFHGKQRCLTCNSVEKVAKETIEKNFASNSNVKFMALSTDDKVNEDLVEQYEISWNGLIITKGNDSKNITEQAFANAVNNPDVLVELIKSEVNNRQN